MPARSEIASGSSKLAVCFLGSGRITDLAGGRAFRNETTP